MRMTSVHERTLQATPQAVGDLVAGLGSDRDVLWPSERWPTLRIGFDRPLGVGARGGHGPVRYAVSHYVPGEWVEFTTTPGSALSGTHEFRILPAGPGRTTLRHSLDVHVAAWRVPLLRAYHDAVVEDVLDCAQRATEGGVEQPARHPRWLALANRADHALARRGEGDVAARVAGVAVPAVLAALGALHAVWASGSPWPAGSRDDLREAVFSQGESMPPDWATWAVAGLLLTSAGIVRRAAGPRPSRRARLLTLGLAGVFALRSVVYLPSDLAGGLATTYERMDLTVYAPLCLAIALGAAAVARRHGPAPVARPVPA